MPWSCDIDIERYKKNYRQQNGRHYFSWLENSLRSGASSLSLVLIVGIIVQAVYTQNRHRHRHRFAGPHSQKILDMWVSQGEFNAAKLFQDYKHSSEIPERLSAFAFLHPTDVVLEIGGNIGGVSEVIARNMPNPSDLVVVEPAGLSAAHLRDLGKELGKVFHVHQGVVVPARDAAHPNEPKYQLECGRARSVGAYVACKPSDNPRRTENLTYAQIKSKYNKNFTAVVIDCEGCYTELLPEFIADPSVRLISIEWDGPRMDIELENGGFVKLGAMVHCDIGLDGVVTYVRNHNNKIPE